MPSSSARLTRVRIGAFLYAVGVILVTTLTTLATHLQPTFNADTPIYNAFSGVHMYINGVSILFILVLSYILFDTSRRKVMLPTDSVYNKTDRPIPTILENALPVSRYQRGAITCFGLVALVLDGIRIVEAITDENSLDCAGHINIVGSGFRLVLNACLIVFILRHHKTIINRNIHILKWGFVHLIATMLADYITMVIVEAYEGFVHGGAESHSDEHSSNETEVPHNVQKRASGGTCIYDTSLLSVKLMPYMLPFVIEFVLLSAATLFKILEQVGMPVTEEIMNTRYIPISDKMKLMFKRMLLPNIIGWTLFLGTLGGTVYFIYIDETEEVINQETAVYVFYIMQIILNVIGVIVIILIFGPLVKIPFTGHAHSVIDQAVLIITIFGFYLLIGFNVLPNISAFGQSDFGGTVAKLGLFENITNYLEGTLQFLFLMDAMRRGSQPMWQKYTRAPALVLILFHVNISLWVVTSFLVKKTQQNILMIDYYGSLTWNIVLYTTLPLAIFFRFHSTICLGDVMLEIWMPDKHGKD